MPAKPVITPQKVILPMGKIARAMGTSEASIMRRLSNARFLSFLSESVIENLYGLDIYGRGSGGALRLEGEGVDHRICLRCFIRGAVNLTRAVNTGSRRPHADPLAIYTDVEDLDYFIIGDGRRLPEVTYWVIRSDKLLNFIRSRAHAPTGLTPAQFDQFIRENFIAEDPDPVPSDKIPRQREPRKISSLLDKSAQPPADLAHGQDATGWFDPSKTSH